MTARDGERAALAAMVVATLLWGGTFVAIRDTVRVMSPATLVFGRFAVASLLLWAVLLARRRFPGRISLVVGAGNGVLMAGSFLLQATGLRWTTAGSSAFLTCAGTLMTALYAWVLLRQRPSGALFAGLALAVAGSALISLDSALHVGRGEWLTLAASSLYALQIIWLARYAASLDPLAIVAVQVTTVALLLAPFAGDVRAACAGLDGPGWLRFAYLAVAGSAIAPLLQVRAQRSLSAGRIGLLFALEPVFALLTALTLGAEHFAPRWWAGAGLILAGIVAVEWRAAAQDDAGA